MPYTGDEDEEKRYREAKQRELEEELARRQKIEKEKTNLERYRLRQIENERLKAAEEKVHRLNQALIEARRLEQERRIANYYARKKRTEDKEKIKNTGKHTGIQAKNSYNVEFNGPVKLYETHIKKSRIYDDILRRDINYDRVSIAAEMESGNVYIVTEMYVDDIKEKLASKISDLKLKNNDFSTTVLQAWSVNFDDVRNNSKVERIDGNTITTFDDFKDDY